MIFMNFNSALEYARKHRLKIYHCETLKQTRYGRSYLTKHYLVQ